MKAKTVIGDGSTSLSNVNPSTVSDDGLNASARSLRETFAESNASAVDAAEAQMDFQRESNQYAMDWSAQEAQKNRDWQEQMSNTAYQRQTADLIAAGLNPALALNTSGASTGSGSTGQAFNSSGSQAQVNTGLGQAVANLMSTAISSGVQADYNNIVRANALDRVSADQAIASMYTNASVEQALINSRASAYSADQAYYGKLIEQANANRRNTETNQTNVHNTDTSNQTKRDTAGIYTVNGIPDALENYTNRVVNQWKNAVNFSSSSKKPSGSK